MPVLDDDAYNTVPMEKPITDIYKQSSNLMMRCSAKCAVPRVVIGFNPVVCVDRSEEGKNDVLPVTISPSEKQITGSSKSGLTSSLETLLSSPSPRQGNKYLQTVNIVSALDSDREICRDRIPSQDTARPEQTQDKFEESACHPIPNAQSELHHPSVDIALSELQGRRSSRKEQSWPVAVRSQVPTRNSESFVHVDVVEADQRSCVFSFLPTYACPVAGTFEGSDTTVSFSFPTMDFMEACYICKRRLGEGLDIFMYKGDKAFCSEECRYHQIVNDDRAERQIKFSTVALKTGTPFQSRPARRNYRINKVLSATSSAAAA